MRVAQTICLRGEQKERRLPIVKKNRVKLGPTAEEGEETPPPSPGKSTLELATSPPHETKVRQISMKVRGLKWDDKAGPESSPDTNMSAENADESTSKSDAQLDAPIEITTAEPAATEQTMDVADTSEPIIIA